MNSSAAFEQAACYYQDYHKNFMVFTIYSLRNKGPETVKRGRVGLESNDDKEMMIIGHRDR